MTATVFDNRTCQLGEGPLWHPEREQLFWFDILNNRLLTQKEGVQTAWDFEERVSAAGWVDHDTLIMASETGLFRFDLNPGARTLLCALEADNAVTRSNDGRADPFGGFWIGTMGKSAEANAGAIYRYYKGELRQLFSDITITNAICFAPDGKTAYYSDTDTQTIMATELDSETGWPVGMPRVFVDLSGEDLNPDGAVVDADGNLWNAQWGAHRVACYAPDGSFVKAISFAAEQISCPAFGGADLSTLYATSAAVDLNGAEEGKTFAIDLGDVRGQPEHQVILG